MVVMCGTWQHGDSGGYEFCLQTHRALQTLQAFDRSLSFGGSSQRQPRESSRTGPKFYRLSVIRQPFRFREIALYREGSSPVKPDTAPQPCQSVSTWPQSGYQFPPKLAGGRDLPATTEVLVDYSTSTVVR